MPIAKDSIADPGSVADLALVQRELGRSTADPLEKLGIGVGARLNVVERDRVIVPWREVADLEAAVLVGPPPAEVPGRRRPSPRIAREDDDRVVLRHLTPRI